MYECENITSIGRRNDDVSLHSSMPNGIIIDDDRSLNSWNCVGNKNEPSFSRVISSYPVSMRHSNFPFTFE